MKMARKQASLLTMKATIDLDDALYRRLKVEAARRGRTVRELVADGIRAVLDAPSPPVVNAVSEPPSWYGALSSYGKKVDDHSVEAMRSSIARERKRSAS